MADLLVMPTEGKKIVARWWLGEGPAPADTLTIALFVNTPDPFDNTLTLADFVPCEFDGYEVIVREYGDGGGPVSNAGKEDIRIGGAELEFSCTGAGEVVTGWILVDDTSGKVLYASLYETPVTMINGATHTVDLKVAVGMS